MAADKNYKVLAVKLCHYDGIEIIKKSYDLCVQELMAVRADLAEAAALRQKQEDILRQRERELTALKGALKDEVSSHDKEIEALREQYSQDMERLRASMEQVSQVHIQGSAKCTGN